MPRRTTLVIVACAVVLAALWAGRFWWPDDKRDVRRRLQALAADFNESTTDGLGTVARAARIGAYFTDDVVLELGQGGPPIRGRETLIGMAARLQPRTAVFTLDLLDMNVTVSSPDTAEVSLTAAFRRRSLATGDNSVDAQELAVSMVNTDGNWLVSHVRAVEPFK